MSLQRRTRDDSLAPQEVTSRSTHVGPVRRNVARLRRRLGASVGCVLGGSALVALLAPGNEHLSAPGHMNRGHEQVACENCHRPAPGTLRQQLQANARFWVGLRETPADFGERDVANSDCLACHERPFDRHPVARFTEPRFAQARQAIAAQHCETCHREHQGVRVTAPLDYCVHCHADMRMKNDPLDVTHAELAAQKSWKSCLGCHDFHGNHVMTAPRQLSAARAWPRLQAYFRGGASPYPRDVLLPARKERQDHGGD